MKALEHLIRAFSLVLMPLNALGGIVAGIWLVIIGGWWALGVGIGFLIAGSFAIGLAMMPGILLAGPAALFQQKGSHSGFYFFSLLSALYMFSVLSAWCLVIFFIFATYASEVAAVPVLLWSYVVATAPIVYMAQRERQSGNDISGLPAFFSQVAYVLSLLAVFFVARTAAAVVVTFCSVMVVAMAIQFMLVVLLDRELTSSQDT